MGKIQLTTTSIVSTRFFTKIRKVPLHIHIYRSCALTSLYIITGTMWYDPVFKVEKFDGNEVWRRRHYRVRRLGLMYIYASRFDSSMNAFIHMHVQRKASGAVLFLSA